MHHNNPTTPSLNESKEEAKPLSIRIDSLNDHVNYADLDFAIRQREQYLIQTQEAKRICDDHVKPKNHGDIRHSWKYILAFVCVSATIHLIGFIGHNPVNELSNCVDFFFGGALVLGCLAALVRDMIERCVSAYNQDKGQFNRRFEMAISLPEEKRTRVLSISESSVGDLKCGHSIRATSYLLGQQEKKITKALGPLKSRAGFFNAVKAELKLSDTESSIDEFPEPVLQLVRSYMP